VVHFHLSLAFVAIFSSLRKSSDPGTIAAFCDFLLSLFFLTCQTTPWRETEGVRVFRFFKKATWTMGILSHFYLFFLSRETAGSRKTGYNSMAVQIYY
jgi:hypothetical protein